MTRIENQKDGSKGAFVLYESDLAAGEMTYSWAGEDKIIIDHTGIFEGHNGKGYGRMLLEEAIKFARENKIKIIPLCPYAKAQFDKTPEYQDVLF